MEQLINFIIRPPRADYQPSIDLLDKEFVLKGKWFQRKDLEIKNCRGDVLQCSHYIPMAGIEGKCLPCVIYCHGNSGCRADASEAAIILLPSNITVFALDFSGSGLSGGEHVTLGWNEKSDLRAVVEYLRRDGNVSLIGLWGRSMGAVTSLMYGAEDPSIAGMVLDSPFSNLVDLMMELVEAYKFPLPKFTVRLAIQYMRKAVQRKAKFDIMELNTIKVAKSCFVPVLIGHATADDFIPPHHSELIHNAYVGDKNMIKFDGDHNSPRPQFYFDSITIFFHNVLHPPEDDLSDIFPDSGNDDYYCIPDEWPSATGSRAGRCSEEVDLLSELEGAVGSTDRHPASAGSSTEDAIKRLRSKRPMSRIEVPSTRPSDSTAPGEKGKIPENGGLCGPHIPPALDDDLLPADYSPGTVSDFPSSQEEEERMLREAILESLKAMDVVGVQETTGEPAGVGCAVNEVGPIPDTGPGSEFSRSACGRSGQVEGGREESTEEALLPGSGRSGGAEKAADVTRPCPSHPAPGSCEDGSSFSRFE